MRTPVSYLQTDSRWASVSYSAPGESTTIGRAGCGPTTCAMVIASLKDSSVTPLTTAKWALKHGYKAKNQGTYYSYFVPQLAAYGIKATRVNANNIYQSGSGYAAQCRKEALDAVKAGHWVIACMGKGLWTSSGHYVLWYGVEGDKALIRDPNSTKAARTRGDLWVFQQEAKYYWIVWLDSEQEAPKEEEMTIDEIKTALLNDPAFLEQAGEKYLAGLRKKEGSGWSDAARRWAADNGVFKGDENGSYAWQAPVTREQTAQVLYNLNKTAEDDGK